MVREPVQYLASPDITPFVLVDEAGTPVLQNYSNGMTYVAGYRTLVGARRGQQRWGGKIWNRQTRKVET